jgi:two-component system CheB/CheR fusion protein
MGKTRKNLPPPDGAAAAAAAPSRVRIAAPDNDVAMAAGRLRLLDAAEPARRSGLGELIARLLIDRYAPACVVVDERYDVLYLQGRTGRYLELPPGEPKLNLLRMARHELLQELCTALPQSIAERVAIVREHVTCTTDGPGRRVRLRIEPFRGLRPARDLLLVAFEEEPQSADDELMAVSHDLQQRTEALSRANDDLANLLDATELGTIFLDGNLCIRRFTPAAGTLACLVSSDVGRPVADVLDDDLAEHAREVRRSRTSQEAEVRARDGRRYLRRILPYRGMNGAGDGVVVTFADVTELREAQRTVEAMLAYANSVVNAVRQPVAVLDKQGRVVQANPAFYAAFKVRREDAIGARYDEIGGGRLGRSDLKRRIDGVLGGGPPLEGFAIVEDLPGLGRRALEVYAQRNAFGTKAVAGEEELTVVTIADTTHTKE